MNNIICVGRNVVPALFYIYIMGETLFLNLLLRQTVAFHIQYNIHMLLPFLSGVLLLVSFPTLSWWPLSFIALTPFLLFLQGEKRFWYLLSGTVIFVVIFFLAFTQYSPPGPLIVADWFLLWMGLPVVLWLIKKKVYPHVLQFFIDGILIFVFGWLIARFSPIPAYVALFGIPLADTPFSGLSYFGGIVGITFFVVLLNIILAQLIFSIRERIKYSNYSYKQIFLWIWILIIMILVSFAGGQIVLKKRSVLTKGGKELYVATVGVGIDFDKEASDFNLQKMEGYEQTRLYIESLLEKVRKILGNDRYDLIVLPEFMIDTKLPYDTNNEAQKILGITNNGALFEGYASLARERNTPVLVNFATISERGNKYNTSILIDSDGILLGKYNKRRLAIGGEYIPSEKLPNWINVNKLARDKILNNDVAQYYSAGEDPLSTLSLVDGVSIGTPICLEGHLPYIQREFKEAGAKFLVHQSSNKWLGAPNEAYYSMVDKLRRTEAIAIGLPIVVSEKNGPAGIVMTNGTALYSFPDKSGVTVVKIVFRY